MDNKMDPFARIPVELRQDILEKLVNLRDLQSAILASTSLYCAYKGYRKVIRQRVFQTEIFQGHSLAHDTLDDMKEAIKRADAKFFKLLFKNPIDDFILGELLWRIMFSKTPERKLPVVLSHLSHVLTITYRFFNRELDARHIEAQILDHLYPNQPPREASRSFSRFFNRELEVRHVEVQILDNLYPNQPPREASRSFSPSERQLNVEREELFYWLRSTMKSCVRYQQYDYFLDLLHRVWCGLGPTIDHDMVWGLLKLLIEVCNNCERPVPALEMDFIDAVIFIGWAFIRYSRRTTSHPQNSFCDTCFSMAEKLLEFVEAFHVGIKDTISSIEEIWNELTPRGIEASSWSDLLEKSYQMSELGQLEGALKVWHRLRRNITTDLDEFENFDLQWARKVLEEMRRLGEHDRCMKFHESVLALLTPGRSVYYEFAWILADRYYQNGDMDAAMRVREQVLKDLQPTSYRYIPWGKELVHLYLKAGRRQEAMLLSTKLEKKETMGDTMSTDISPSFHMDTQSLTFSFHTFPMPNLSDFLI